MKYIVDKKLVLKEAMQKETRIKVAFTLDRAGYELFQKACEKEGVPMSRALDVLIKQFNQG